MGIGVIVSFFSWLFQILKKFIVFLFTVPGQVLTACGTILGTCYVVFTRFTWLQPATQSVQTATSQVSSFISQVQTDSPIFSALYSFFAFDYLIEFAAGVVVCTVGVLVALMTGIFSAIVLSLPGILVARATLKLIRISSGGIVDP